MLATMWEMRNENKQPLKKAENIRHRWDDNIKMDLIAL
jgi:hypothetical protein